MKSSDKIFEIFDHGRTGKINYIDFIQEILSTNYTVSDTQYII